MKTVRGSFFYSSYAILWWAIQIREDNLLLVFQSILKFHRSNREVICKPFFFPVLKRSDPSANGFLQCYARSDSTGNDFDEDQLSILPLEDEL